jgi:hypothetical protein
LSFLTKVGNMGFGNLVLILPIKHEYAHVVVVKNGGCNTSHSKSVEQTFFRRVCRGVISFGNFLSGWEEKKKFPFQSN